MKILIIWAIASCAIVYGLCAILHRMSKLDSVESYVYDLHDIHGAYHSTIRGKLTRLRCDALASIGLYPRVQRHGN
jgi:hypothetical protein